MRAGPIKASDLDRGRKKGHPQRKRILQEVPNYRQQQKSEDRPDILIDGLYQTPTTS